MSLHHVTPVLPAAAKAIVGATSRRSPGDWAHVLAFGAVGWPWLLRSLSGGSPAARAELLALVDLPDAALPPLGGWRADAGFLLALARRILIHRPAQVVELGGGASTLVAARALALAGGGQLTSYDHHGGFIGETRDALAAHGLVAEVREAPLDAPPGGWPGRWYGLAHLPERIDLLVVDGPPWSIHPYVRGAAETLFERLPVGGAVLLDDAARPGERVVARRWRRRWPGFRFAYAGGGKGLLLGERIR